jgi:predicted metal-dependent phosphoesterase TrpH
MKSKDNTNKSKDKTNKSKDKTNKSKGYKGSEYKTKEERQEQVRNIINEITKLGLSIQYQPVKELYECLRSYIEEGVAVKINIPFDEINRTIVGQLKIGKREECVVCLQNQ